MGIGSLAPRFRAFGSRRQQKGPRATRSWAGDPEPIISLSAVPIARRRTLVVSDGLHRQRRAAKDHVGPPGGRSRYGLRGRKLSGPIREDWSRSRRHLVHVFREVGPPRRGRLRTPCDVDVEVEVASHRARKTAWSVAAFPTIREGGARRQAECQGCQPKASIVEHGETSKKRKERAAVIQGCRQLNMPHERRTGQLKRPAALTRGPGEVVVIVS